MKPWLRVALTGLLASTLIHALLLDLMRGEGSRVHQRVAPLQARLGSSSIDTCFDSKTAREITSTTKFAAVSPDNSGSRERGIVAQPAPKIAASARARESASKPREPLAGQGTPGSSTTPEKPDATAKPVPRTEQGGTGILSLRPLSRQESLVAYRAEVASVWRLPPGDARALERGRWHSVLLVSLGTGGAADSIVVAQGSGEDAVDRILMRGLREAAAKVVVPPLLRGEPVSVEFEFLGSPAE